MLAWLASALSAIFADSVLRWVAFKTVIVALAVVTLPILLNNAFYDLIDALLTVQKNQMSGVSGSLQSFSYQLTGLSAWLGTHLRVVDSISFVLSCVAIKFTLGLIPFVRV